MKPSLWLHCDSIITRSTEKKNTFYLTALYTRDHCSKSLTRPLSQVFTYVNKCPTHRHLVWDIRQCIQFYGYNKQTFYKSRYPKVYVGRIIELQLIYCIYFIPIPMLNGLSWWRKRICMYVSVLKIETVRVQASPLPWQAEVTVL